MNKLKNIKNIKINKSLVFLLVVFAGLFFVKAYLYNIIGNDVLIEKIFDFIPEQILFYAFLPIYYVFLLPVMWILGNLSFFNADNNQFVAFSLDIFLTIIYLTILFFILKNVFHFFKKQKS